MGSPDSPRTLWQTAASVRVVVAVLSACLLLLLGDLVAWAVPATGASLAPLGLVAAVGATCFVGLSLGLAALLLVRAAGAGGPAHATTIGAVRLRVSPVAALVGAGVAAAVIVAGVMARTRLLGRPEGAAAVDLGVVLVAFAAFAVTLSRPWARREAPLLPPRFIGLGCAILGVVALVAGGLARDALVGPKLWDLWAIGVVVLLAASLALLLPGSLTELPSRWRRGGRGGLVAAGVLSIVGLWLMQTQPHAREGAAEHARPGSWVLALASLVDFDGDGYSALLGGGDCDDGDPQVNPDAPEVPGNGRDENCRGGDRLASSPFPHRPSFVPLPEGVRPKHVVLITVDTLRADHMSLFGYRRQTTPYIDAWARGAVIFRNAYASAPYTRLAMPLIVTGRYLSQIPWNKLVAPWGLQRGTATIAEVLSSHRITSEAIVTHRFFSDALNWTAGFTHVDRSHVPTYEEGLTASSGPEVSRSGLRYLTNHRDDTTFLWMHYYDPHASYMRHESSPDWGNEKVDRYDGEIRWTDAAIGEFLEGLRRSRLEDDTAVILLSDHGEEFGDHGGTLHGTRVWQELVHVPLIMKIPGVEPREVRCPTGYVDVAPTITNLFGVDGGPRGFSGASLVPDLLGQCDEKREVVSELRFEPTHEFRALIGPRYKLVQNITNGTYQLYDLQADPDERTDVRERHADVLRAMTSRLLRWTEHVAGEEFARVLAEATVRRLPRSAMRIGAKFGDGIELVGADLGDRVLTYERSIKIQLFWRVTESPPRDCQVKLRYLDRRGRQVIGRTLTPLNSIIPFERFPHGRILRDVNPAAYRGKKTRELRIRVGVRCGDDPLPVEGGRRRILSGRWVDLGTAQAIAGSGDYDPRAAE